MSATVAEKGNSATPILDRLAPLPQPAALASSSRTIPAVCVGLALAILATFIFWHPPFFELLRQSILMRFEEMLPGPWTGVRVISFGSLLLLIGFSVTAIHELGHVLAGSLAGFRCSMMFVGPLQFHGPFRISLNRHPGAWWHGGATVFPIKKDNLCLRGIAMVSGGPAANLLSGCAVLLLPFPKGFFLGTFIVVSIVAGVIELLLPLQGRTFVFDARRIWMLLRNPEEGERWLALMGLQAELNSGVLPESMSADFLAKAIAVRDHSADTVVAHAFAYAAAFHRHNDEEAGQMLEICLSFSAYAAGPVREALICDAAIFQARRRKCAALAEQWFDVLPETTRIPWLRSRVEAAIFEARGQVDGALQKLDENEKIICSLRNHVQREILLQLLQRWKSELHSSC